MSSPSRVSARSGALAAFLSFLFPGLGQGYLRQTRMAVIFALPFVVLIALLLLAVRDGLAFLALRLLDPTVATIALIVVVQIGAWRLLSVLHAWRHGTPSAAGRALVAVLALAIVATHGVGVLYSWSFVQSGQQIFSGDSSRLLEAPPTTATPGTSLPPAVPVESGASSPPSTPASSPAAGAESPAPAPTDSEVPPDDPPDDRPELGAVPGPPSGIEEGTLEATEDGFLNVLLVGIDWKPGRDHALTDTMMVVSVDGETGEVYMFSFPRDIAEFPLYDGGTFLGRLNSFAPYAERHPERYPKGGLRSLARQVGFLLGIPIDHYAAISLPGFEKLIRVVGPLTINNPTPIDDPHLGFRLDVGRHRLNVDELLMYVRSRKGPSNSDFERARRQQEVLAAIRTELMRPGRVVDLPRVLDAVADVITTDFPPGDIDRLLELAELVSDDPTGTWVLKSPDWADHPPTSETNGRWVLRLRMDRLRDLSLEVFGERSLYSKRR